MFAAALEESRPRPFLWLPLSEPGSGGGGYRCSREAIPVTPHQRGREGGEDATIVPSHVADPFVVESRIDCAIETGREIAIASTSGSR